MRWIGMRRIPNGLSKMKTVGQEKMLETPQAVTSAQINLWFHDFIEISEIKGQKACTLDEAVAYVWVRMIEHLNLCRKTGRVNFVGSPTALIFFSELKDIMTEFEKYSEHPENGKTLSSLIEWIRIQTNALLEHRKAKVG